MDSSLVIILFNRDKNSTSSKTIFSFRPFTWVDDKGKKIRMSAHQYVELVIVSVEKFVTDEGTFPTKYGKYNIFVI